MITPSNGSAIQSSRSVLRARALYFTVRTALHVFYRRRRRLHIRIAAHTYLATSLYQSSTTRRSKRASIHSTVPFRTPGNAKQKQKTKRHDPIPSARIEAFRPPLPFPFPSPFPLTIASKPRPDLDRPACPPALRKRKVTR